jgi:hypothetical protein
MLLVLCGTQSKCWGLVGGQADLVVHVVAPIHRQYMKGESRSAATVSLLVVYMVA